MKAEVHFYREFLQYIESLKQEVNRQADGSTPPFNYDSLYRKIREQEKLSQHRRATPDRVSAFLHRAKTAYALAKDHHLDLSMEIRNATGALDFIGGFLEYDTNNAFYNRDGFISLLTSADTICFAPILAHGKWSLRIRLTYDLAQG